MSSMTKLTLSIVTVLVVVCVSTGYCIGTGGDEATVNVSMSTTAISALSVDSPSLTLEISTAAAGEEPEPVTSSFMYSITNNEAGKKLVGQLGAAPPEGLDICGYAFVPPGSGGTSCGWVELSTTPVEMVTNIGPVCAQNVPLTIQLCGSVAAGVQSSTAVFTMTLTSTQ
jgi:hypothetical protein